MPREVNEAVNQHSYPEALYRHPVLLRILHMLGLLVTLRTWHVWRLLRRLVRAQEQPFTFIDAGCGAGDFMLPLAAKHPASRFIGVDKNEENIALCRAFAEARRLENVAVHEGCLESYRPPAPADLVACIGVMQYIEGDEKVLSNFAAGLKPGGRLVLYVSLEGRRVLRHFDALLARFDHYDAAQGFHRTHEQHDILRKVREAGFEVESADFTYGAFGRVYYEVYSLFAALVLRARWGWYLLLVPVGIALVPFLLLLMFLDFIIPNREGNGLLLVARKPKEQVEGRD